MATLVRRYGKTPNFEIQFFLDGHSSKRFCIYLGGRRYSEKTAVELKVIRPTPKSLQDYFGLVFSRHYQRGKKVTGNRTVKPSGAKTDTTE